jgi:PAS domain-containing protein
MAENEQKLQASIEQAKLLAAAVEHLAEGVLITNDHLEWPGPHIVFVNDAMCQITGYGVNELVGQTRGCYKAKERTARRDSICELNSPRAGRVALKS